MLTTNLGLENYAIFALLTGLIGWFTLADMGVGYSAQNYISEARARKQPYAEIIVAANGLAILFLGITVAAFYLISPYIAPRFLREFPSLSLIQKENLLFLTGALSIGASIGGISYKIWYAEQKGYLSGLMPCVATAISFIGLVAAKRYHGGQELSLNILIFLCPAACLPLAAMISQAYRAFKTSAFLKSGRMFRPLVGRALQFWLFAFMSALVLQVDYIVMSQTLKPGDIAAYNLSTKIFGFVLFIYSAILAALWPIYSEAIVNAEWETVLRRVKAYLFYGLSFVSVCTVLLIWLMPLVIRNLSPSVQITIPPKFIFLLGVYHLLRVWTDTFAMLLQSMNELKPLWILVPVQAVLSAGLQSFLAPRLGLYGIVGGLIGSFVLTVSWALPLIVNRKLKTLKYG
jgi:O-antigen/teichoic acid export membrane protein